MSFPNVFIGNLLAKYRFRVEVSRDDDGVCSEQYLHD